MPCLFCFRRILACADSLLVLRSCLHSHSHSQAYTFPYTQIIGDKLLKDYATLRDLMDDIVAELKVGDAQQLETILSNNLFTLGTLQTATREDLSFFPAAGTKIVLRKQEELKSSDGTGDITKGTFLSEFACLR